MNKKVYIYQDGTIPGCKIIEELKKRGGNNIFLSDGYNGKCPNFCYYIKDEVIRALNGKDALQFREGYTELFYNKETDSFYEVNECSGCTNDKGCINCQDGDMKETYWGEKSPSAQEAAKSMRMVSAEAKESLLPDKLIDVDVAKEGEDMTVITIPDGYEATIEGRKITVKKKKWEPKKGDRVWLADFDMYEFCPAGYIWSSNSQLTLHDFQTEEECQAFCDKLNAVVSPILEERRKEVER